MLQSKKQLSLGKLLRNIFIFACMNLSNYAFAGARLSLSGSHSDSNAGYQKIESGSLSAGIAFDIWEYFRIGYTHRQKLQSAKGYKEVASGNTITLVPFKSTSLVISNSVDLTAILYAGDIFTPYIFIGAGPKTYKIENQEGTGPVEKTSASIPAIASPNGGVGMSIRLNQKFSLTMSHMLSLGSKQEPNKEVEVAIDSESQVGIQYTL